MNNLLKIKKLCYLHVYVKITLLRFFLNNESKIKRFRLPALDITALNITAVNQPNSPNQPQELFLRMLNYFKFKMKINILSGFSSKF